MPKMGLEQLLSSLDNQQAFSRNSLEILHKLEFDVDLSDTAPDTEENSDSEDNANPDEQEQDKKDEQGSDDGTHDDTAIDDDFDEVDDNIDDTSDIGEQDANDSDEQSRLMIHMVMAQQTKKVPLQRKTDYKQPIKYIQHNLMKLLKPKTLPTRMN